MHHRRKPDKPLTTRNAKSRIVTMRLPYDLEAAIKEEAEARGKKWQTVLKELLSESLGLDRTSAAEVKRIPATALQAASKRLKKK
jgi:hypothetical protein